MSPRHCALMSYQFDIDNIIWGFMSLVYRKYLDISYEAEFILKEYRAGVFKVLENC